MPVTLADLYAESAAKFPNNKAFLSKDEKKNFTAITYKELYETGLNLAEALVDLGVAQREFVALLADNRKEWIISDCGILLAGAADVPRGTDITDVEIEYILNHCEAKVIFVEHDKMLEKLEKAKDKLKFAKTFIMMDPNSKDTKNLKLYDLIEKGKALREKGIRKAEERIANIKPDDLFTVIYTSGTTGTPKGVMLKHENMVSQAVEITRDVIEISNDERILSILPIWHVFERVFEYIGISQGVSTYYTNVRDMRDDLRKVRPTFMASAPRLWENIYQGIYNRINDPKQTPAIRKFLFNVAYAYSKNYGSATTFLAGNEVDYVGRNIFESLSKAVVSIVKVAVFGPFTLSILSTGIAIFLLDNPPLSYLFFGIAGLGLLFNSATLDFLVLSKIREATGGKLKASVSGGGALQRHVDQFFNNIGINVLEGYGMTETSPVISVRTFKKLIQGSVGGLIPRTELQVRDDSGKVLTHIDSSGKLLAGKRGLRGVFHVRGAQVMKGYYKNEEATKKVLKEGWMDTGDIGMLNFKNTLTITGRAKDTVVLLGGENVEPVPIENKLLESPFINQVMVIGQDQKNLGAIIVPDFDQLTKFAKENGISENSNESLVKNQKVLDLFRKEIKSLNNTKTGFKSFEQVTPFLVITKAFEVGDEMTNLMKIKRHVVAEKYKKEISELYASSNE